MPTLMCASGQIPFRHQSRLKEIHENQSGLVLYRLETPERKSAPRRQSTGGLSGSGSIAMLHCPSAWRFMEQGSCSTFAFQV